MIVDLHSHYPLHVLAGDPGIRPELESPLPAALLARLQRVILRIANEAANYPHDGGEPAVTGRRLFDSPIRIAFSVLYIPFDEMDLDTSYGSPPEGHYFGDLRDLLLEVNHHVATHDRDFVEIAPDLDRARAIAGSNRTALIHAVEGGFHLGDNAAAIETNVAELARLGVAYITVAHLFWRQIATNVPAIPFLPDETYEQIFPQPASGLAPLGRALITAMHRQGILVDLCHMSRAAIADTFALLDTLDPGATTPVIATHGACRAIHDVEHNLHDEDIARIMSRAGVIGLIASSHWMAPDGRSTKDFEETMEVLWSHVDHIEAVATRNGHRAGHHYCAIGSDQDGFIKPPLKGLEFPAGYTTIEEGLMRRYGAEAAARICSGNALRVLGASGGMTH